MIFNLLLSEVGKKALIKVPGENSTVDTRREQCFLPFDVDEALLSGGHVQTANYFVVNVRCIEEDDCTVAKTNCDTIFVRTVLDGQNNADTLNIFLPFHRWRVINTYQTSILLKENHFVDLLKVINLLDVVVVRCLVCDIKALCIAHIRIARGALIRLLNLVLNQISRQLLKFQSLARVLLATVKKINQRLDKIIAVR